MYAINVKVELLLLLIVCLFVLHFFSHKTMIVKDNVYCFENV